MVSSAAAGRLIRARLVDGGVSRAVGGASSRSDGGGERGVSESEASSSFLKVGCWTLLLRSDLLDARARTSLAVSCEALDVLIVFGRCKGFKSIESGVEFSHANAVIFC